GRAFVGRATTTGSSVMPISGSSAESSCGASSTKRSMAHHVVVELNLPNPALVLLVGPSGAGKTTFARDHFARYQVVSSDELRAWVSDDPNDQAASADAFRILALLVNGRLKRRLTAVVDATNLRA